MRLTLSVSTDNVQGRDYKSKVTANNAISRSMTRAEKRAWAYLLECVYKHNFNVDVEGNCVREDILLQYGSATW